MKEEYPLLKIAPPHDSPQFIDFLRTHNNVFWENDQWIVIENCKYHTPEKPWYTAFWKGNSPLEWYMDADILWHVFGEWEWLKKSKSKQTVRRFHIHLIPKSENQNVTSSKHNPS